VKYQIDELDRGIIRLLSKDGRMSFTELSANLKVTEKTIRLRYKNLIDQQIIDVVGVVNPISLGLKAGAIILLKVKPQGIGDVIKALQKFKEIRYITMVSGPYSLLIQINVRDQDGISQTLLRLNEIPYITEVNSIVQLEVYKNSFDYD
jgi:Lrp/AsnC family transcriptional regulator, regulator for asnA, asnC and gidA